MQPSGAVTAFGVLNLVWAGLCAFFAAFVLLGLAYGVFFSGDPPQEIFEGAVGGVFLLIPALGAGAIYLLAGVWLLKRRVQGYYLNLVGAGLAVFSCAGLFYAIPALVLACRPGFRNDFFAPASSAPAPVETPLPTLDV